MKWYEITIHTTEEAVEIISNFLHEIGVDGVSIEESGTLNKIRDTSYGQLYDHPLNDIPEGEAEIRGYFPNKNEFEMEEIKNKLTQSTQGLKAFDINIGKAQITYKEVYEEDWANEWKQYFKPVRVSERVVIKPTWETYEVKVHDLVIELDPGMAFGTGTHETTALCLRTIEEVLSPGDGVIDVGTGSGILAIAAAKLGARHVLAIDLDPVAVHSATENVQLNQLSKQITVIQSDLLQILQWNHQLNHQVHLVIANILADVIISFVQDVYDVLLPGGKYITSGIIRSKEGIVLEALTEVGFHIVNRYYENDWVAIVAGK